MCSNTYEKSNYPEWPESFKGYYHDKNTMLQVYGKPTALPDVSGGPDPNEVREWKKNNNASVTQVCEHFGLSRVQVVKVVGE